MLPGLAIHHLPTLPSPTIPLRPNSSQTIVETTQLLHIHVRACVVLISVNAVDKAHSTSTLVNRHLVLGVEVAHPDHSPEPLIPPNQGIPSLVYIRAQAPMCPRRGTLSSPQARPCFHPRLSNEVDPSSVHHPSLRRVSYLTSQTFGNTIPRFYSLSKLSAIHEARTNSN